MKPHRMRMTHDLLTKYDVLNQMEVPFPAPPAGARRATAPLATASARAARASAETAPRSAARDGEIRLSESGALHAFSECRAAGALHLPAGTDCGGGGGARALAHAVQPGVRSVKSAAAAARARPNVLAS